MVAGEPEGVGGAVNRGWREAGENRERSTNDAEDGGGEGAAVVVVGGGVDGELISCSEHALVSDAVAVSEVVEGGAKS